MRILILTDWPSADGGVETYVVQVTQLLRARGHEVRIVASDEGRGAEHARYVAHAPQALPLRAVTQLASPAAVRATRRAVRELRPDAALVVMFEMALSPAAVLALGEVPYVHVIAYYKPICPNGLWLLPDGGICNRPRGRHCRTGGCIGRAEAARTLVRYRLIDAVTSRASAHVTCSAWMRATLSRTGVDAVHLAWPVRPPSPGLVRGRTPEPLFVVAGRLAPEKGLDTLVDAVALLRRDGLDVHVEMLGDGAERAALERRAHIAGVSDLVRLPGWAPPAAVDEAMARAWAVAAPSRWAEPLGLSAVEAIAAGVPVVATATGGYAETVEPGRTGLLVENGDVGALASALATVATEAAFTGGSVDDAARRHLLARYDPERHGDALETLLERICR